MGSWAVLSLGSRQIDDSSRRSKVMSDSALPSSFLRDDDLQYQLFPDIPELATEDDALLSPLDRWRNSPPEVEAAQLSDIVKSISIANTQDTFPSRPNSEISLTRQRRSHRPTASIAASDSARSSGSSSSASSAHSIDSGHSGSFGRFYAGVSKGHRRRRQRKKSPTPNETAANQPPTRQYQCTFCTDTFKSKHDWTRHERTLHLSLESWTCAPFGPTYLSETSLPKCVFCTTEHPSDAHIREHRFWECQEKPHALRTFYRKDHMFQHLRLVHGMDDGHTVVDTWRSEVTQIKSRCGFCAATFRTWADRNSHIAVHFREGYMMKQWRGCRGLDPAVALAVENAMPPYLIGAESSGIDPFSASKGRPDALKSNHPILTTESHLQEEENSQPTPFEVLTEHLIRFVHGKQAAGDLITDESIQQEARFFVYGDDDSWNQTAADNMDWLQLFKDGMGLCQPSFAGSQGEDSTSPEACFPLPWTANMTPGSIVSASACARAVESPDDPWMPWAWQSPECLAEYRRSTKSNRPS